ncbi:hypothetical protein Fcan01_09329 [Folsomia candida]|uniref:Uncharacterized protein n=2 Tax=Folsomia candida TaxID=158441 RepID=A0A226EFD4_FOLCA|nr:hypothetical protein Fcan01_09329 [Folsomia candida]
MFHQSNKLGLVLPLIYIYLTLLDPVVAKGQYVVPLNMGMKVSIPYDIANLFGRFPIQGALSVVLALALNAILFFGVITAPFGYFFGIPSKKYVLGDVEVSETSSAAASKRMDFVDEGVEYFDYKPINNERKVYLTPSPRSSITLNEDRTLFYFLEDVVNLLGKQDNFWTNFSSTWQDVSPRENAKSSEFLDIIWKLYVDLVNKPQSPNLPNTILDGWFSFMPQSGSVRSKSCDLLSVCYAHGALKRLPNWLIKIYHVFSGKMAHMPSEFKDAILQGMKDEGQCVPNYSNSCAESPFTIVLKSVLNFLPMDNYFNNLKKRKQAMYM